ncbi:hypothetical protein [Lysobacter antibioticus]|uniref:Transmembrane protein n=1 Tax=Lysobacter antibioticus TaxID=84531 RepID=A0A0S2F499_LYSAN|nr:hypothetical protein [Lysobacter antibioticus]ALN78269.1 hypothetical protein LA76x_0107 [Lysobacter antibioticus]
MQTESVHVPASAPAGFMEWVLDKFKQHPKTTVVSAATLWGGAIVLHHFFRIGYLPVLAVSDLLGVVIASAAIGLILLAAVTVLLVLPGLMLIFWRRAGIGPKTIVRLRADRPFRRRWKHTSYALTSAAAALLAVAVYSVVLLYVEVPYLIFLFLVPPMAAVVMLETPYRESFVIRPLRKLPALFLFQLYCYVLAWSFIALILLLWQYERDTTFLANTAMLVVAAIFLHLVMLAVADMPGRAKIVVPMLMVIYVLVFTSSLSIGAGRIISFFGLGQISRVDIALTKAGCDTVNAIWSKRPCVVVSGGSPSSYLLPDVDLVTRIGPHYLLGERGVVTDLEDRRLIRVAVRSEDVLGWARVREEKAPR